MSDLGTLVSAGTVRFERVVPGPIERAWSYLTERDRSATYFMETFLTLEPQYAKAVGAR